MIRVGEQPFGQCFFDLCEALHFPIFRSTLGFYCFFCFEQGFTSPVAGDLNTAK